MAAPRDDSRSLRVLDLAAVAARGVDLGALVPGLPAWHPRLVQQALYVFMSRSNRRLAGGDCTRLGMEACLACPAELVARCPVRHAPSSEKKIGPSKKS